MNNSPFVNSVTYTKWTNSRKQKQQKKKKTLLTKAHMKWNNVNSPVSIEDVESREGHQQGPSKTSLAYIPPSAAIIWYPPMNESEFVGSLRSR